MTANNAPNDEVTIAAVHIVEEIEAQLETHGNKLSIIAILLMCANDDVYTFENFSFNLGDFIFEWQNEQKKAIEKAMENFKSRIEYIVYRSNFILDLAKNGGQMSFWTDEIQNLVQKLKNHIDIIGKSSSSKEIDLLINLQRLIDIV